MGGADKTTKGKDHASLMLNEAILAETVRKEQRVYKLYENYTFSPKALKSRLSLFCYLNIGSVDLIVNCGKLVSFRQTSFTPSNPTANRQKERKKN